MPVLIGYGYTAGTTGIYFERAFGALDAVEYAGTAATNRPGFPPDVNLAGLAAELETPPDLFLYVDSGLVPYAPVGLQLLPFPTAGYFMDAYPPEIDQRTPYLDTLAPMFDYVFAAHKGAVARLSEQRGGLPVHWLPPACDPDIHRDMHLERIYDVGFVGQLGSAYPERMQALAALEQHYKLNDYRRKYYLEDMARIYNQSKIVLNLSHTNRIMTMRTFEAPACGALLLTKRSSDNGQELVFEEGKSYATFATLDELLEKVDYYLQHAEERERVAGAGQNVVLAKHTYAHRTQAMLAIINADGRRLQAPMRSWSPAQTTHAYLKAHAQLRMIDSIMNADAPLTEKLTYTSLALLRRLKHLRH